MSTTIRSGQPSPTLSSFTASTLPVGRWRAEAVCAQVDPELFFPDHDDPVAAKSVCRACPVRSRCLEDALERNEIYGVWGGLTTGERAAERRRRRADGTRARPTAVAA